MSWWFEWKIEPFWMSNYWPFFLNYRSEEAFFSCKENVDFLLIFSVTNFTKWWTNVYVNQHKHCLQRKIATLFTIVGNTAYFRVKYRECCGAKRRWSNYFRSCSSISKLFTLLLPTLFFPTMLFFQPAKRKKKFKKQLTNTLLVILLFCIELFFSKLIWSTWVLVLYY